MRLRFSAGNGSLSYGEFLQALAEDQNFRELIQDEMRAAPYVAFRWETPPLTSDNLDQPVHGAPNSHFKQLPEAETARDNAFPSRSYGYQ